MPPPTASGRISRERFKGGSHNCTHLSGTIGLTNLLHITSQLLPVHCKMQLNTVQKCVTRIRLAKGRIIRSLFSDQFFYTYIHADLIFSHTGYDITSCFQSAFTGVRKMTQKMSPQTALGRILAVQRFAWANHLVGFLLHGNLILGLCISSNT